MRGDEIIQNKIDDKQNIYKPIIIVTVILLCIIGCFIWLGIKNPVVFSNIRDLTITLIAFLFFIIGVTLAILFFYFASKIEDARVEIDQALSKADGKVEDLGDKITEILKKILDPVFASKSNKAGILNVFKIFKTKEK